MENPILLASQNRKDVLINPSSEGHFVLDLANMDKSVHLTIGDKVKANLALINLTSESEITIDIQDESYLKLSILDYEETKTFKITANIGYKSVISSYFADFIIGKCKGEIVINLNKEYATCDWKLASLSLNKDNKEFDVSVYHNAINTYAQMDNYGVCRNEGKLIFSGICKIVNGSHGSKAHQNAKIMVFDELSNGVAKPILKIDENDIEASHAAVVGKINDEHIFYLTSRGLSEDEAKRIITLGYLKPILKGFDDGERKTKIEDLIEGKK